MIRRNDDDDRSRAALELPFVRGGAPPDLWPRIEAAARRAAARRRARASSMRIAAFAAGFAACVAIDALWSASGARSRTSESGWRASELTAKTAITPSHANTWWSDPALELPPEARLVAALLANEKERR